MPRRLASVVALVLAFAGSGTEGQAVEPRWLIEAPTAGVLAHTTQAVDVRVSGTDVLAEFEIGFWSRTLLGVAFGAQNLFGVGATTWNPDPGVSARVRVLNETATRPAFAVGFRSQGAGEYDDALRRYREKSLGVYGVFSRNYANTVGQGGLHIGMNRSLEDEDGDPALTGFVGADLELGGRLSLLGEYHFALNDDSGSAFGRGRGYMNVGVRLNVVRRVWVEFDLKDVLENNTRNTGVDREARLIFLR